ncbi:hypothetical protein [Methanimicrococcus hacksteinii]|nr:hypothetical protein [Methanimicrococcus sp. At1]
MAVCIAIISACLFHYVPPEYVKKTIVYTVRDIMSPDGDIVIVYPPITGANPERFKLSDEGEAYNITYTWSYDRQIYSYAAEVPLELFNYYQNKSHTRRDYGQYAVSEYDRELVQKLAGSFRTHGDKNRYSEEEIALNVISFVHTIPYTYDIETTGFEEYPRYPAETLVEGGDCEDRAILAAAVLYELDIDCILIHLKNHMAVGLKDSGNFTGKSYKYNDTIYYYAGVADGETQIGIISPETDTTLIGIYPIEQNPVFSAKLNQYMIGFDDDSYKYVLQGNILNSGSGNGKNVTLRVETTLTGNAQNSENPPDQLIHIGEVPEDYNADIEVIVYVPRDIGYTTIYVEGDNFDPIDAAGFYFSFSRV